MTNKFNPQVNLGEVLSYFITDNNTTSTASALIVGLLKEYPTYQAIMDSMNNIHNRLQEISNAIKENPEEKDSLMQEFALLTVKLAYIQDGDLKRALKEYNEDTDLSKKIKEFIGEEELSPEYISELQKHPNFCDEAGVNIFVGKDEEQIRNLLNRDDIKQRLESIKTEEFEVGDDFDDGLSEAINDSLLKDKIQAGMFYINKKGIDGGDIVIKVSYKQYGLGFNEVIGKLTTETYNFITHNDDEKTYRELNNNESRLLFIIRMKKTGKNVLGSNTYHISAEIIEKINSTTSPTQIHGIYYKKVLSPEEFKNEFGTQKKATPSQR